MEDEPDILTPGCALYTLEYEWTLKSNIALKKPKHFFCFRVFELSWWAESWTISNLLSRSEWWNYPHFCNSDKIKLMSRLMVRIPSWKVDVVQANFVSLKPSGKLVIQFYQDCTCDLFGWLYSTYHPAQTLDNAVISDTRYIHLAPPLTHQIIRDLWKGFPPGVRLNISPPIKP